MLSIAKYLGVVIPHSVIGPPVMLNFTLATLPSGDKSQRVHSVMYHPLRAKGIVTVAVSSPFEL